MALPIGDGCHPGWIFISYPGDVVRPIACFLFDEPRRAGSERVLGRSSALPNAVEIESSLLCFHRTPGWFCPFEYYWRDDEHRHFVRVHSGVCRSLDHSCSTAGTGAWVPRPGCTGRVTPRHHYLCSDDLRAWLDQLVASARLAGNWP